MLVAAKSAIPLVQVLEDARAWKNATETAVNSIRNAIEHETWKEKFDSKKDFFTIGCGFTEQWGHELAKTVKTIQEIENARTKLVESGLPSLQGLTEENVASLSPAKRRILDGLPTQAKLETMARVPKNATVKEVFESRKITEAASKNGKDHPTIQLDKLGQPIPDGILAEWNKAEEVGKKIRSMLGEIKAMVGDLDIPPALREPASRELLNTTMSDLESLRYSLKQMIPHAVCDKCQGRGLKSCTRCYQRGFLSKFLLEACPTEKKK